MNSVRTIIIVPIFQMRLLRIRKGPKTHSQ